MPHPRDVWDSYAGNRNFLQRSGLRKHPSMHNARALSLASDAVRRDKDYVMAVAKLNGTAIYFAHDSLRDDPDVVMQAIKQDAMSVCFASSRLKEDPEVMLEAVKRNCKALQFASVSLMNNPSFMGEVSGDANVMLEAVRMNVEALEFADDSLLLDKSFMLQAVQNSNGECCDFLPVVDRGDMEFMIRAMEACRSPAILQNASFELQHHSHFVKHCVRLNGLSLRYAGHELRDRKDITLLAVKENGNALKFASKRLKNDRDVVALAIKQDPNAEKYSSDEFLDNQQKITTMSRANSILASAEAEHIMHHETLPRSASAPGGTVGHPGSCASLDSSDRTLDSSHSMSRASSNIFDQSHLFHRLGSLHGSRWRKKCTQTNNPERCTLDKAKTMQDKRAVSFAEDDGFASTQKSTVGQPPLSSAAEPSAQLFRSKSLVKPSICDRVNP